MFYAIPRLNWAMLMFFIMTAVTVVPFANIHTAHADEAMLNLPESINVSGRQRMLTQRIVKFYYMVGLDVQKEASKKEMQKAAALFNRQLRQLEHVQGVDQSLIDKHLQGIQLAWQPVERLLASSPNLKDAPILRQKTDEVLALSHDFVSALESVKISQESKLVNTSGRQRMLSQRIASFYMERVWGVENKDLAQKLAASIGDFNYALETLLEAKENTPEITALLEKVEGQWHAFTAINKLRNLAYAQPEMVSESAENILALMNEITGMYAGL